MKWSDEQLKDFLTKTEGVLNDICVERGRDFTFKCKQIADRVGTSSFTLARFMPVLEEKGIVMKKYKSPAFAAGTRREEIALCEEKLGIPLREFVEISLEAMKGISDELGL